MIIDEILKLRPNKEDRIEFLTQQIKDTKRKLKRISQKENPDLEALQWLEEQLAVFEEKLQEQ